MKRYVLITLMTLLILSVVPLSPQANSPSFSDISTSYAKEEIEALAKSGVIDGYTDGTFRPTADITRAEFAKLLAMALNLPQNTEAAAAFNDVPIWAEPYIGALVDAGVTKGVAANTFGSTTPITRQDMMVMIVRGLGYDDYATFLSFTPAFKDFNQISNYAYDQIGLAANIQLARGTHQGYFLPKQAAHRQDAARWIYEVVFEQTTYDRHLAESAIPRVYGSGNVVDVIWHDDDTVEIQLFEQPTRVVELDELLSELHGTLQYFYLSRQYGHDWIEYSNEEKREYVGKMVAFWEADYSFFRVTNEDQDLVPALVTHLNSFFNEDNLYYSIGEKLENYALENGYIERTE
ncbi:S-layer homology domain-containing protein [Alkalihalophilus marmarensis]|uniref:SLH domain-containing protein n=1 Tax=Alkalihalophilus marmarensis DSM 21297 TaxID=1188261 RepID=U6SKC7_9BACI|nr:S-layer homology domain-containing protein [Alkalihalophilus marmarensis]ERN52048.1 hypothetical protein A33I_18315 [Alkalihalophilus marmarensis DSM 21297]